MLSDITQSILATVASKLQLPTELTCLPVWSKREAAQDVVKHIVVVPRRTYNCFADQQCRVLLSYPQTGVRILSSIGELTPEITSRYQNQISPKFLIPATTAKLTAAYAALDQRLNPGGIDAQIARIADLVIEYNSVLYYTSWPRIQLRLPTTQLQRGSRLLEFPLSKLVLYQNVLRPESEATPSELAAELATDTSLYTLYSMFVPLPAPKTLIHPTDRRWGLSPHQIVYPDIMTTTELGRPRTRAGTQTRSAHTLNDIAIDSGSNITPEFAKTIAENITSLVTKANAKEYNPQRTVAEDKNESATNPREILNLYNSLESRYQILFDADDPPHGDPARPGCFSAFFRARNGWDLKREPAPAGYSLNEQELKTLITSTMLAWEESRPKTEASDDELAALFGAAKPAELATDKDTPRKDTNDLTNPDTTSSVVSAHRDLPPENITTKISQDLDDLLR